MTKTIYLYVCFNHVKLGKFVRDTLVEERQFFAENIKLHLHLCQVKGCQFPRDQVIELTFNRVNDDLELVSLEAKLS